MSGCHDYDDAQKLKKQLKVWETAFVKEHNRKPKKEDIDAAPEDIQETYKSYNRLKKQIQERIEQKKTQKDEKENQCVEGITADVSPTSKSFDKEKTEEEGQNHCTISSADESVGESEVWGRQFDRKKTDVSKSKTSDTESKKPNQYLQKLSSKLFDVSKQIGDAKPSYRRSKPLIIPKEVPKKDEEEKNDIYDYTNSDKNAEFKMNLKNELFQKAVSLTSKKSLIEFDSEDVVIPVKAKVKSKPNLSQFSNSFCENESESTHSSNLDNKRLDKFGSIENQNWDEIDNLAPFEDESHKNISIKESGPDNEHHLAKNSLKETKTTLKKPSSRKISDDTDESEEPMEVDDESYKPKSRKVRKPVSVKTRIQTDKKVSEAVQDIEGTSTTAYDFKESDDVPVVPKYGKRKADGNLDGQSKKRKIKASKDVDLDAETNTDTVEENAVKPKKSAAPARSKASSSASSENFVRLNMKVKTYKRKGRQGKTGPQMKRFLWKQKMKARSQSYGNKCFKCGQEGHWANKCTGGAKAKEEMDDQPPVLEDNFPTLKEATMMAKGIKVDTKEKKIKKENVTGKDDNEKEEKKEEEEDIDDIDIEAGIVRTTREVKDAPPPMKPFLAVEEIQSDIPDSVKKGLKMFGYEKFRHGQEKAVLRVLSGQSTLVVLSTGGGKSLTYQLPAVLYAEKSDCFTLVISPLVSLMEDQITGLPPGVRGACLHTNMTKAQRENVMESVKEGKVHFLLVSPEAIAGGTMSFLNSAANLPPISFVCIDEAHCLSEWSHNFRPSYLRLTKVLREKFGVKCFLGLTATATKSTASDVAKHLGIDDLEKAVVRGPPVPKNLLLSVSRDENREEALIGILQGDRFTNCESIIIYCTRRETTERLATLIRTSLQDQKGDNWTGDRTKRKGGKKQYNYWDSESYHAGLSAAARKRVQNAFMSGRLRVVVATVAFGMGLDKSNVRGVIHYNMPKSFESYVQEIGRAGRDGKPSHCHLFLDAEGRDLSELRRHTYSNTVDYRTLKKFIQRVFVPCKCKEVHIRHKEAVKGFEKYHGKLVWPKYTERLKMKSFMSVRSLAIRHIYYTSDNSRSAAYLDLYLEMDSEGHLKTKENEALDAQLLDDWNGEEESVKRTCPGHERAIPVESFVMDLDVKEEGIATLFCYLELHKSDTWKVENLTNVYSTCNIQCYGGPALLQHISKKCPPVAVAIAKAKKDGENFAGKTNITFPVVEISDCMGWDSGPVKRELKMLMWDLNGANGPRRTGVVVEFTDLAFHFRAPGDLSEEEIDDVIMSLHNRIQKQEKAELTNLKYLSNTLHSVSHKNYWMCADDLDENKNAKLKGILEDYFQEQTDFNAAVIENTEEEISSYELAQVRSDIRQFINMYSQEHKLNGRAIARIFHGIGSPCFPATTWGRARRFWRSNINVDFNVLIKLSTRELVEMR